MTTPSIVPAEYAGTSTDYLKVKSDRSGADRLYAGAVSVPSGTVTSTVIGLVPFNKGARFHLDNTSVYFANIGDGSFTADLGYIYDDNVTYTNNTTAWASASTAGRSGGFVTIDAATTGIGFVAAANGWIAVTTGGSTTDATGNITFQFSGAYDGLGLDNSNNQSA